MKIVCKIVASSLMYSLCLLGYSGQLIFPMLIRESQSNIVVTAVPEHEKPCPPEYTNLISNTNLFSLNERDLLKEIPSKYLGLKTNFGPRGTVFKDEELRQWKLGTFIKIFPVSCFVYTNTGAHEEIAFFSERQILASFRMPSGDGYDVNLIDGRISQYQEYKNGVMDGLCVSQVFDAEHCNYWARFVKGKIVGRFLGWNEDGKIDMDAEFKEPFDFSKYQTAIFVLSWTQVSTDTTNSAKSEK